ncbi:hypothetical protein Bca4012_027182 [Brassica carinata]
MNRLQRFVEENDNPVRKLHDQSRVSNRKAKSGRLTWSVDVLESMVKRRGGCSGEKHQTRASYL